MSEMAISGSDDLVVRLRDDARSISHYSSLPNSRARLDLYDAADEIEALRDLLTDIYLYIDWRYITKQQTTEQKELFASVVEAAGMTPDRWWNNGSYMEEA
jgi:hypothetical protein